MDRKQRSRAATAALAGTKTALGKGIIRVASFVRDQAVGMSSPHSASSRKALLSTDLPRSLNSQLTVSEYRQLCIDEGVIEEFAGEPSCMGEMLEAFGSNADVRRVMCHIIYIAWAKEPGWSWVADGRTRAAATLLFTAYGSGRFRGQLRDPTHKNRVILAVSLSRIAGLLHSSAPSAVTSTAILLQLKYLADEWDGLRCDLFETWFCMGLRDAPTDLGAARVLVLSALQRLYEAAQPVGQWYLTSPSGKTLLDAEAAACFEPWCSKAFLAHSADFPATPTATSFIATEEEEMDVLRREQIRLEERLTSLKAKVAELRTRFLKLRAASHSPI